MSLKFTTPNSRVDLGMVQSLQLESNHPFTFETWVTFQEFRNYAGIFSKNNGMSSPYTYMLTVQANGTLCAYTGSEWVATSDVAKALQLNILYHIAYVYDGYTMKYYINQELVGEAAFTYTNNLTHNCRIGSWYSATYYPSAIMDGCRFWNKVRTQQELIDNKTVLLTGSTDGLLGAWDFQNVKDSVVNDLSINKNYGTIYDCTLETNLVEFSKIVDIKDVDIVPSNFWYTDIDDITMRFRIDSEDVQSVKYNLKIDDEIVFEETNFITTPTDVISYTIPKRKFTKSGNGKVIELGNIVPIMTSYTFPSGIVSSSTQYDTSNYQPWRAFDKVDTTHGWLTQNGVKTGWIAYEFPIEKVVVRYRIKSGTYMPQMPKKWNFEGYDVVTGQWEVLDGLSNQPVWTSNEWRDYPITNKKAYKKYRINIFENNGGSYSGMNEIELIGAEIESSNKIELNLQTELGYVLSNEYSINREDRDTVRLIRSECYPSEWVYYNTTDFNIVDGLKLANLKTQGYITTSDFNRYRTTGKRKILNCEIEGEKLGLENGNVIETVDVYDNDLKYLSYTPDSNGNGISYEYDLRLGRFTDVLGMSIDGAPTNKSFIESENSLYTFKNGLITSHKDITSPTAEEANEFGMDVLTDLVIDRWSYLFASNKEVLEDGYVKRFNINTSKLRGISKMRYSVNIENFGDYRAWSDGTYAKSATEYIHPSKLGYIYDGDIGDGIYRIQPDGYSSPIDVYCDMTRDDGGWMLVINTGAKNSHTNPITSVGSTPISPNQTVVSKYSDVEINALRGGAANYTNSIIRLDRPNNPVFKDNPMYFRQGTPWASNGTNTSNMFYSYYISYQNASTSSGIRNIGLSYSSAISTWSAGVANYMIIMDYTSEGLISNNNYEGSRSERGGLVWVKSL